METFEVGLNAFFFCIMIWLQAYGDQGVECGGLKENDPHRMYVFVVVGMALLEEVCHSGDGHMLKLCPV